MDRRLVTDVLNFWHIPVGEFAAIPIPNIPLAAQAVIQQATQQATQQVVQQANSSGVTIAIAVEGGASFDCGISVDTTPTHIITATTTGPVCSVEFYDGNATQPFWTTHQPDSPGIWTAPWHPFCGWAPAGQHIMKVIARVTPGYGQDVVATTTVTLTNPALTQPTVPGTSVQTPVVSTPVVAPVTQPVTQSVTQPAIQPVTQTVTPVQSTTALPTSPSILTAPTATVSPVIAAPTVTQPTTTTAQPVVTTVQPVTQQAPAPISTPTNSLPTISSAQVYTLPSSRLVNVGFPIFSFDLYPMASTSPSGFPSRVGDTMDANGNITALSTLMLYENGVLLGPAHSPISKMTNGAYLHLNSPDPTQPDRIYFTSSDNTDPSINGRVYTVTYGAAASLTTVAPITTTVSAPTVAPTTTTTQTTTVPTTTTPIVQPTPKGSVGATVTLYQNSLLYSRPDQNGTTVGLASGTMVLMSMVYVATDNINMWLTNSGVYIRDTDIATISAQSNVLAIGQTQTLLTGTFFYGQPNLTSQVLGNAPAGTVVTLLQGPQLDILGNNWWLVSFGNAQAWVFQADFIGHTNLSGLGMYRPYSRFV